MCVDVKKGVLLKRNLTTKKQQHPPPPDLDFTTNEMTNNGKMARKAQRGNRGETEQAPYANTTVFVQVKLKQRMLHFFIHHLLNQLTPLQ